MGVATVTGGYYSLLFCGAMSRQIFKVARFLFSGVAFLFIGRGLPGAVFGHRLAAVFIGDVRPSELVSVSVYLFRFVNGFIPDCIEIF